MRVLEEERFLVSLIDWLDDVDDLMEKENILFFEAANEIERREDSQGKPSMYRQLRQAVKGLRQ